MLSATATTASKTDDGDGSSLVSSLMKDKDIIIENYGRFPSRRSTSRNNTSPSDVGDNDDADDDDVVDDQDGPVTIVAKQPVIPGKEGLFEDWVREVIDIQQDFEGFLSNEVIRPVSSSDPEEASEDSNVFTSIFRYKTFANLKTWVESNERKIWLEKAREFLQEPIQIEFHSTEFWYVTEVDPGVLAPSREKMCLVTFLVIWLQVHFITPLVGRIPNMPPLAQEAFGTAVITAITTYVMLPLVTKYLLHWWLFPKKAAAMKKRNPPSAIISRTKRDA